VRPPPSPSVRSENELRLQFDHPWRCIRTQTRAIDGRRLTDGLCDLSELVAVHVCVWEGKVRMIEEVGLAKVSHFLGGPPDPLWAILSK